MNYVSESISPSNAWPTAGLWIGDCFIYTNGAWRLNYCVGGEVTTMFHLDRPMYLLGYLAAQSQVYLIDKVYFSLPISSELTRAPWLHRCDS